MPIAEFIRMHLTEAPHNLVFPQFWLLSMVIPPFITEVKNRGLV
jgi:hypothetical protein